MRRFMSAFVLSAMMIAPAAAQNDSSPSSTMIAVPAAGMPMAGVPIPGAPATVTVPNGNSNPYAYSMGAGRTGTAWQLATFMNCGPDHPGLWATYPAEREARLGHLYHHLNGCDCLNPKRHLHCHPSLIGHGGIGHGSGCADDSCATMPTAESATGSEAKAAVAVNRYKSAPLPSFPLAKRKPFQIVEKRSGPLDSLSVQVAQTPAGPATLEAIATPAVELPAGRGPGFDVPTVAERPL
jgi:hypothetical protein